ncbi:unnamed protein product [Pieris macdunnoughi]|uniref:Uncharacterized protein n=1 Tax=Pieris macdunnoughi TaxID=345717 RepID=A0A821VLJ4_9NEOP|nr:unnamed protein product [Pieris macdunnoughi]
MYEDWCVPNGQGSDDLVTASLARGVFRPVVQFLRALLIQGGTWVRYLALDDARLGPRVVSGGVQSGDREPRSILDLGLLSLSVVVDRLATRGQATSGETPGLSGASQARRPVVEAAVPALVSSVVSTRGE